MKLIRSSIDNNVDYNQDKWTTELGLVSCPGGIPVKTTLLFGSFQTIISIEIINILISTLSSV